MRVFYDAMVLREPYSGVEVTVHQLAAALSQHGKLPVCACVPTGHRAIPDRPHLRLREVQKVSKSRLLRILWEQTVLPVLLSRSRASLLHAPAYVAPVLLPCPLVLTVHDLHVMTHPQFCGRENRLHYKLLMPQSIRRSDKIIVFSEHTRRNVVERFPFAADRIVVIPPGLTPGLSRCENFSRLQQVRQKYRLPTSFLLFVGDLTSRKNITGLISAFDIVQGERPDLHLVLAGAADSESVAAIDRVVRRYGIGHRVMRAGYVELEDLGVLYSLAQAFVFPSHDEGFGLPPLEAMACGCPVVCSGGAAVENCGDAAVSCDPRDTSSIASAVSLLLDHPSFRRDKIRAGYVKAAYFMWERAVRVTEQVYLDVMRKNGQQVVDPYQRWER